MKLDNDTRNDIISQINLHMPEFFHVLKAKLTNPDYDSIRTMVISDSQAVSDTMYDPGKPAIHFEFETGKRYDYLEMLDILEVYGFIEMTDEIASVIFFYRIYESFLQHCTSFVSFV